MPARGKASSHITGIAVNEEGRWAGEVLERIDYSPLGDIILARDETYFDGLAFLIGVESRTYVLLAGQVEESCDGETWGLSLAFDQARDGLRIVGLSEDGARFYSRSRKEAAKLLGQDFSVPVQKDVWHGLDKAAQTVTDLEQLAHRKLEQAQEKGDELADLPWDEVAFEVWATMDEAAERLVEMSGRVRFWYGCLCDALEIVDWRSGEIRDREINEWLLEETPGPTTSGSFSGQEAGHHPPRPERGVADLLGLTGDSDHSLAAKTAPRLT